MNLIKFTINKIKNFFKDFENTFIFIFFLIRLIIGQIVGVALFPFGLADDLLMLDYASKLHYTSPNINSLVKNMSFPILLDIVHISKISWTIWYSLIWFFPALIVYILVKKLTKNKILSLFFYVYVLFFYSAFTVSIGLRVYRNCIIQPFVIMFFGLMIILIFNLIESFNKKNIYISMLLGFIFAFTYYIKEDGVWMLCVLIFSSFLSLFLMLKNKIDIREIKKNFICLIIPFLIFILGTNLYKAVNLKFFGVYEINTRTEGELGKFVNNVYKVESENRNSFCWAPYDAIEKVFENSKTLSVNKELCDGILHTESFGLNGDIKEYPIHGDFLGWVLRYELDRAGLWTNEKEVSELFKKINFELYEAFKSGKLKKDKKFQLLKSTGGLTFNEIIGLFPLVLDNMKSSIFLNNISDDKLETRIFTYEYFLPILEHQLNRYVKILNMPEILNDNFNDTIKITNTISNTIFIIYKFLNTFLFIILILSIICFIYKFIKKKITRLDLIINFSSLSLFILSVVYAFCISWFINFLCIENPNNKNLYIIFYNTATSPILIFSYIFGSFYFLREGIKEVKCLLKK